MAKSKSEASGRRLERWRALVRGWRESGLSQAEFCRRRGIPAWKLAWWKKRLAADRSAGGSAFVPIQVVTAAPVDELALALRGGRVLRFGSGVEPTRLAAIVAALEALPAEALPC